MFTLPKWTVETACTVVRTDQHTQQVKKRSKKCTKAQTLELLKDHQTKCYWSTLHTHMHSVKGQPDLVWGVCPTGCSLHHGKGCSGNRGPPNEVAGSSQSNPPHHPAKRKQQKETVQDHLTNEVSLEKVCWHLDSNTFEHQNGNRKFHTETLTSRLVILT